MDVLARLQRTDWPPDWPARLALLGIEACDRLAVQAMVEHVS